MFVVFCTNKKLLNNNLNFTKLKYQGYKMSVSFVSYEYVINESFLSRTELPTILCAILLIIVFKSIADKCRRDYKFIKAASALPGPPEFPLLGNGFDFLLPGKGGVPGMQKRHTEKYGSMYRVWFGNQLWICLSDPTDIQTVYQSTKLVGRRTTLPPINKFFGEGINSTTSIPRWREERHRLQPILTKNIFKFLFSNINDVIYKFVDELYGRATGVPFDVKHLFSDLTLDIIARMEFSYNLNEDEKSEIDLLDNSERVQRNLTAQIFFPILQTKFINFIMDKASTGRIKSKFYNLMTNMLVNQAALMEEAMTGKDEEKSKIFLSSFVSSSYRVFQKTGNKQLLLDELLTMFVPATAPTARLLSYGILMMAIHSDAQEKLFNEIYDIFGEDTRWPEFDDIIKLTYLDQIFKECLRLYNPVTTTFRELDEDLTINSHHFPAGTGLLLNVAYIHLNAKYYPEPHKFNPENFSAEAVAKRPKTTFMPFGGGSRRCLGLEYTSVVWKLTLTALVRHFAFHTSMKMNEINMVHRFFTFIHDGNYVTITSRIRKNN